jgi:predicted unusual protein kinase regulating ubiquinone biosynthesis (AarF/ABC1/UbiB family)
MFRNRSTISLSGKSKKDAAMHASFSKMDDSKSVPGLESKTNFWNGKKSSKSESLAEKMMKNRMEKIAAKMQEGGMKFPPGVSAVAVGDEDGMSLQQLEADNQALSSKCRKLEAQNIIAAAQMVDFLAIMIGLFSSIVAYFVYSKIVWWILDYDHFSSVFVKCIALALPYIYNKLNYDITYRRFQVFAVAFVMIARIKIVRWRVNKYVVTTDSDDKIKDTSALREGGASSHFGDDITADDVWEANYEINARFLYSSILRLRGLWVKTAQYLSSRADFVPVSYVRELSKLQDEAPETEWKDVQKMLAKAGVLHHFSHIEEQPIASASIGQVHAAVLKKSAKDNRTDHTLRRRNDHEEIASEKTPLVAVAEPNGVDKVVIKVQHPHAQILLMDDFRSLKIIAWIMGILEPEYKFVEILMREWANEAKNELDFRTEVENLETARASIKKMNASTPMMTNHADEAIPFSVEIPRPLKALSSKCVLVMTFCEGKRIDDIDQIKKCNVPREAVMDAVSQAFAYMMYVTDIFNGDPHPGEFLWSGM